MPFPKITLFGTIVRHEGRLLWRSGSALAITLLFMFWMGLAVRTGITQRERQEATVRRTLAKDAKVLQEQVKDFTAKPDGFHQRPYIASLLLKQHATLPPGPLAALDTGQSDLRNSAYPLHTDWQKVFFAPGPLRNEASLRSGQFDTSFLVVYLLPLTVIALCFSLLAGDREKGTMLLLQTQPVSPGTLLAAALLVRFALVETALLGSAALFIYTGLGANAPLDSLPRFGLWAATVTVYNAFWFALSAAIVASGGKSASNALILVMGWGLLTVVVPGLTTLAANVKYPIPPRTDIMRAVNIERDEAFESWRENENSFRLFYKDFPELIPAGAIITPKKILDPLTNDRDFQSRVMIVIPYSIEQLGLKLSRPHQMASKQRLEFLNRARLFSPVIAARESLMDIAGTGDARYDEFNAQTASFWSSWRYQWVKRIFRGPLLTPEDYRRVPQFQFQEENTALIAARILPGIAAMLFPSALLGGLASVLLRRNNSPLPAN